MFSRRPIAGPGTGRRLRKPARTRSQFSRVRLQNWQVTHPLAWQASEAATIHKELTALSAERARFESGSQGSNSNAGSSRLWGIVAGPGDQPKAMTDMTGMTRERLLELSARAVKMNELEKPGAGEWLGRPPQDPTRDVAVAEFVRSIRHMNPDAAQTWAETIQDPDIRSSVLEK